MRRVSTAVVAIVCALAVGAASAQAITIEPLSTKFSGERWSSVYFGPFECQSFTVAGTTNATKTNYVELTPGFTKCYSGIYAKFTNTTKCAAGKTVPWTWTLSEGSNPYKGSITVNCVGTLSMVGCNVEIVRQTTPSKVVTWKTAGNSSRIELSGELKYTSEKSCEAFGFKPEGTTRLGVSEFEIRGIKAV
jgi:hypothetical protein